MAQKDVLIAAIYWDNSRRPTVTAPTGWTAIRRDGSTSNQEVALYYRVAGATEPTSYTWTSSRNVRFTGIIAVYRGASITAPVDAQGGQTGSTASPVAPSITAVGSNDVLVAVWSGWDAQVIITPPAGLTTRTQFSSTDPIELADAPLPGAGAIGTQTATASASPGFWTGQAVALAAGP
jgi:hypothetical protein